MSDLKKRILEKQGLKPKPAEQASKPAAAQPAKGKKGVMADEEEVLFSCGHKRPLHCVTRKKCGKCQEEAKQELDRLRRDKRPPGPPLTKVAMMEKKMRRQGRLPHGSKFDVVFNSETETWTGTLTILGSEAGPEKVFSETWNGVFRLLAALDSQYRDWVEKLAKPAAPVSEVTPAPEEAAP